MSLNSNIYIYIYISINNAKVIDYLFIKNKFIFIFINYILFSNVHFFRGPRDIEI